MFLVNVVAVKHMCWQPVNAASWLNTSWKWELVSYGLGILMRVLQLKDVGDPLERLNSSPYSAFMLGWLLRLLGYAGGTPLAPPLAPPLPVILSLVLSACARSCFRRSSSRSSATSCLAFSRTFTPWSRPVPGPCTGSPAASVWWRRSRGTAGPLAPSPS